MHGISPGSESIVLTAPSLSAMEGRVMCGAAHESRGREEGRSGDGVRKLIYWLEIISRQFNLL